MSAGTATGQKLNVKQLSFRLSPKIRTDAESWVRPAAPTFFSKAQTKDSTNKNQNATIMKDYLSNSERDPKRDALTRDDWVVYGIIAPLAFIIILGVGEAIGRIFG